MQHDFTLGPWLVEHDEQSGHYDIIANGSVVAQVHYVDNAPCPIGEANARLIASAPALLEALQAIVTPTGFANLDAGGIGSHGKALAAIASATGAA